MGSSPTNEGIEAPNFGVAEHAACSDVGSVREGNEDAYLDAPPLFVVADGMGGASAGEVASGIVVEAIDTDFGATTTRAVAVPCTGGDDESRTATRMVNVPDDCG